MRGTAIVFHFVYTLRSQLLETMKLFMLSVPIATNEMSSWEVETQETNKSASFAFIQKWTTPNPAILVSLHSLSGGTRSSHRKEM